MNVPLTTPTLYTARLLLRPFTAADTDIRPRRSGWSGSGDQGRKLEH